MILRILVTGLWILVATNSVLSQLPYRARFVGPTYPFASALAGFHAFATGDADGDGMRDFVVEGDDTYSSPPNPVPGGSFIYSGRTGATLSAFSGDASPFDDLDGDGIEDVLVAHSRDSLYWQVFVGSVKVYSSADGSLLRSHYGNQVNYAAATTIGADAVNPGDVDLDGFRDYAYIESVNPGLAWNLIVRSGATGALLSSYPLSGATFDPSLPASPGVINPRLAVVGDVNGDGRSDILLSTAITPTQSARAVLSLWNGTIIHSQLNSPGGVWGSQFAPAGDADGDGLNDYYQLDTQAGAVELLSGATGGVLHTFSESAACRGIDSGDVDGDGVLDLVSGWDAAFLASSPPGAGAVRVYSGASQQLIYSMDGLHNYEGLGWRVSFAGDMDGDGAPEILARSSDDVGPVFVSPADAGWRILSPFGAREYGAAGGSNPLQLAWSSAGLSSSTEGVLVCDGADPFAGGVVAVSLASDQATISGLPLLVAIDSINLLPLESFGFDVTGRLLFPLSIKSAFVGGSNFYLQAFQSSPPYGASNGLDLLFTN